MFSVCEIFNSGSAIDCLMGNVILDKLNRYDSDIAYYKGVLNVYATQSEKIHSKAFLRDFFLYLDLACELFELKAERLGLQDWYDKLDKVLRRDFGIYIKQKWKIGRTTYTGDLLDEVLFHLRAHVKFPPLRSLVSNKPGFKTLICDFCFGNKDSKYRRLASEVSAFEDIPSILERRIGQFIEWSPKYKAKAERKLRGAEGEREKYHQQKLLDLKTRNIGLWSWLADRDVNPGYDAKYIKELNCIQCQLNIRQELTALKPRRPTIALTPTFTDDGPSLTIDIEDNLWQKKLSLIRQIMHNHRIVLGFVYAEEIARERRRLKKRAEEFCNGLLKEVERGYAVDVKSRYRGRYPYFFK